MTSHQGIHDEDMEADTLEKIYDSSQIGETFRLFGTHQANLDSPTIPDCPQWKVPLLAQATVSRKMAETVKIKVTGYLKFRSVLGDEASLELETEEATLRDALRVLRDQYGEGFESILFDPSTKEIKRSNLVLLNGQPCINLVNGLDTELKDGDEITFSPVLAGG